MTEEQQQEQPPNFFTEVTTRYPDINQDGKIDLVAFLEASKCFIQIYDLLGTAFYVVKKDMAGNIEKLYKAYNCCPEKYKYLNDLINDEREVPDSIVVDALLWLKRALEFTVIFINGICGEFEKGIASERLDHLATEAYNQTLKKYHKWIVQNIFKVVVKSVPYRSGLVKALYFGKVGSEEKLFQGTRRYTQELENNLSVIISMYDEWGLNNDRKV